MSEELHVRLSDSDAKVVKSLIDRGIFKTQSEVVRFGIKRLAQTESFESMVTPTLTPRQRLAMGTDVESGIPPKEVKRYIDLDNVRDLEDLKRVFSYTESELRGDYERAAVLLEQMYSLTTKIMEKRSETRSAHPSPPTDAPPVPPPWADEEAPPAPAEPGRRMRA